MFERLVILFLLHNPGDLLQLLLCCVCVLLLIDCQAIVLFPPYQYCSKEFIEVEYVSIWYKDLRSRGDNLWFMVSTRSPYKHLGNAVFNSLGYPTQ